MEHDGRTISEQQLTQSDGCYSTQGEQARWHFDIIIASGFVLLELATITDVIRIANRVSGVTLFSWSFHSTRGGSISSSSGLSIDTFALPDRPVADAVFFIGNSDPNYSMKSIKKVVSKYRFAGARVYLLSEAATRYISESSDGGTHTTHWENYQLIRETLFEDSMDLSLAREGKGVVTCAGMEATSDVVLALIGQMTTPAIRTAVADIMLHQSIRDFSTLQPYSGGSTTRTGDEIVDRCIHMMQTHIEDPLRIKDIVLALRTSSRMLERRFARTLNSSPHAYYRSIRLTAAQNLLLNTGISIQEVALACGYNSGFAEAFNKQFGFTPTVMRRRGQRQRPTSGYLEPRLSSLI